MREGGYQSGGSSGCSLYGRQLLYLPFDFSVSPRLLKRYYVRFEHWTKRAAFLTFARWKEWATDLPRFVFQPFRQTRGEGKLSQVSGRYKFDMWRNALCLREIGCRRVHHKEYAAVVGL